MTSYEQIHLHQRFINNSHMRTSSPEIKPRHFVGSPQKQKFLTKRSPSFSPQSNYQNITPIQRPQNVQFKTSNPETFLLNKQKAYTPPEQSNSYPFAIQRPNTPDGRSRPAQYSHEPHPIRIKEYHYVSPLAANNHPEVFQMEMYTREDAKDMEIERLSKCLQQSQNEVAMLKQTNDRLIADIDLISVERIQAKNLLTHETQENTQLMLQLNLLNREIAELKEKHLMVSKRAGFGIPYGHVHNFDHQFYKEQVDKQSHYHIPSQHTPATRVYSNEIEEMKVKLRRKDRELEEMRVTCEHERKEKQDHFKSYEHALQLLEKEIAGR